jgi:membrane protease YdiL (CAAX protease family)
MHGERRSIRPMTDDMQPYTAQPDAANGFPRSIAPWQHTLAIVAILALWALISGGHSHSADVNPRGLIYASGIMMSWMLLGSVVAGVYLRRRFFIDTLQRHARPWYIEIGRGFAIYFASLVLFVIVGGMLYFTPLRDSFDHTAIEAIAPRNALQLLGWLAVSLTAGFCEEHVFRGYLLPQVIAWLRAAGSSTFLASAIAVAATSILFGSLHLYQGLGGAILVTCLGAFYAVLALRFGNLRAVIVAHAMLDFFITVLIFLRHALSH